MRTKLFAKSNAVLTETSNGEGNPTICIIECGKNEEISAKVKLAIKEHHIVDGEITIDVDHQTEAVELGNQQPLKFSAEWVSDGEPEVRDFELQVIATYK